jgi:hypothetical protein
MILYNMVIVKAINEIAMVRPPLKYDARVKSVPVILALHG